MTPARALERSSAATSTVELARLWTVLMVDCTAVVISETMGVMTSEVALAAVMKAKYNPHPRSVYHFP